MHRRFSLLVDDRPDVLLRVCSLLLRRRATVAALSFGPTRHPGWARLDVEVAVDERHGRGLAERLAALVDVRDVAELARPCPAAQAVEAPQPRRRPGVRRSVARLDEPETDRDGRVVAHRAPA